MTLFTKLTKQPKKNLTLCADDYGQNIAISEGIVTLVERRRINAVSCMVNGEYWGETYPMLRQLNPKPFIGLHLNFTYGAPLSYAWKKQYGLHFPSLTRLISKAYLRRLNPEIVTSEIRAQFDVFTQDLNLRPDFIDGHQHVHQLPVIRDALLAVCAQANTNPKQGSTEFRKTVQDWRDFLLRDGFPKRQLITLLGGFAFRNRLIRQSIPSNTSFSGIYHFKHAKNYRRYFNQFLAQSQDGGLIMCHPGNPSDDKQDPQYLCRHHELNYFMSNDYLLDLKNHAVELEFKP